MELNCLYAIKFAVDILFQDDSDDEETDFDIKNWNFAEQTVPNFSDQQFQFHFRLTSTTFENVLLKLHSLPNAGTKLNGNPETSLEKQLLIAISYLANMECLRSLANRFGVSKSTAWSCLYKVCRLLLQVNMQYGIIQFPNTERCNATINEIIMRTTFADVIGAVDGSHIPIVAPKENPVSYINRKGFHSVVLQGTCNNKKLFIHCYVGEAGSVHDACVHRRSGLIEILNEMDIPQNGHLFGDSAYPLSPKLLTPFKDNGHLNNIQRYYNKIHSKTRVVIEQAFALLKGRFRRLKLCETRRHDLIPLITFTACILHNLCLLGNDIPNDLNLDREVEEERLMNVNIVFNGNEENARVVKRNDVANMLYLENLRRREIV